MITHYFRFNRKMSLFLFSDMHTNTGTHTETRWAFYLLSVGGKYSNASNTALLQLVKRACGMKQRSCISEWHLIPAARAGNTVKCSITAVTKYFYFPGVGPTMHPALKKSQLRDSVSVSVTSFNFSTIITPRSSQRHFPKDRVGENIFVNVWTDFLLMIHNFGMQSGNDDNLFLYLPLLMKRNCLWG